MRRQDTVQANGTRRPHLPQTGEHCPTTGWWVAPGSGRSRFIAEGDLMPPFDGCPVTWAKQHTSAPLPRKVTPIPAATLVDEPALSIGPQEGSFLSPTAGGCDEGCLFCSLPETD